MSITTYILKIIIAILMFIGFWSIAANQISKINKKSFKENLSRLSGLAFWDGNIKAQLALTLFPSLVLTFLTGQLIPGVRNFFGLISLLLVTLFSAIPIINTIIYPFVKNNEQIMKKMIIINSIWLTVFIVFAILMGSSFH